MINFVLQALDGIFTIVFVVGIGYVLSKKGWFDDKSSALIAKLVTTVSLPLYMITSLTKNFTAEKLVELAPDMLLPVCSMLLALIVGKIAAKLLHVRQGRRGVFVSNFFIANTMFIGLPVNLALFGDESIPSVMLYYMVNLTFFWTLGVQNIVADIEGKAGGIFSMQAAMPAMTQMAIVCKQYGGDSRYAAALSFITIIGGLLVIPVYMTVVNMYF